MDGVPVFSLVADAMPSLGVSAFRGVVNTTCGYILAAMERGVPFAEALGEMQRQGIAEADPSLDIDGWDAAAKAAALANVLLDARLTPHDVARAGIRDLDAGELVRRTAQGQRLRLVSQGRREGDHRTVSAAPLWLAASDPLATCRGLPTRCTSQPITWARSASCNAMAVSPRPPTGSSPISPGSAGGWRGDRRCQRLGLIADDGLLADDCHRH